MLIIGIAGGTGSGDVNKAYVVDLKEGLTNVGYELNSKLTELYNKYRWVLIIIFFEILIPPEPFMRDAPHFFYRKYNKNLL